MTVLIWPARSPSSRTRGDQVAGRGDATGEQHAVGPLLGGGDQGDVARDDVGRGLGLGLRASTPPRRRPAPRSRRPGRRSRRRARSTGSQERDELAVARSTSSSSRSRGVVRQRGPGPPGPLSVRPWTSASASSTSTSASGRGCRVEVRGDGAGERLAEGCAPSGSVQASLTWTRALTVAPAATSCSSTPTRASSSTAPRLTTATRRSASVPLEQQRRGRPRGRRPAGRRDDWVSSSSARRRVPVLAEHLDLPGERVADGLLERSGAERDADGERQEHRDERDDVVAEVDHRSDHSSGGVPEQRGGTGASGTAAEQAPDPGGRRRRGVRRRVR